MVDEGDQIFKHSFQMVTVNGETSAMLKQLQRVIKFGKRSKTT